MADVITALSLGAPLAGAGGCDHVTSADDALHVIDAPTPEGGGLDAAPSDADVLDAMPIDAGRIDAGPLDAFRAPRSSGHASFTPPGPNEPRYAVHDETIEDEITGLVWERFASTDLLTLEDAHARCEALSLEAHDDFRVPSRVELVSLLRTTRSPTIDPIFEGTEAEYHWSSSLHPIRDASATTVYFGAAEIVFALAADRSAVVRCVRGGRGEGAGPAREAGRVVDRGTRLVWDVLDTQRTYAEAVRGCEALALRMPTLDELASVVDDARSMPAIDLEVLGGEAGPTWSSSAAQTSGERIGLDLAAGPSVRLRESERAWARCVTEAP
ncbi:MAG: DUF1566 domain-containing protein [Deltaproteobacteria bacterium]|nr:DUF1566 domain-containing protein [Deltaproteobacteria bacterium]